MSISSKWENHPVRIVIGACAASVSAAVAATFFLIVNPKLEANQELREQVDLLSSDLSRRTVTIDALRDEIRLLENTLYEGWAEQDAELVRQARIEQLEAVLAGIERTISEVESELIPKRVRLNQLRQRCHGGTYGSLNQALQCSGKPQLETDVQQLTALLTERKTQRLEVVGNIDRLQDID